MSLEAICEFGGLYVGQAQGRGAWNNVTVSSALKFDS